MRPGRELDCAVAKEVLGHTVYVKKRVLFEVTPQGERPLRNYTKEIQWAWEVAEKMSISLIPIENGSWFAMVGNEQGWKSPAEFIQYLQAGNFLTAGAAVGPSAPLMICTAAMKAVESQRAALQSGVEAASRSTTPILSAVPTDPESMN